MMKILFQSRATLFTVPGGDTIQVVKTAEALRKKGCAVDISTELEPDVSSYDIVHLFNLIRPQETYLQALNAKKQGKKIALSTIFVSFEEADQRARTGLAGILSRTLKPGQLEYLKMIARAVKNFEFHKGTLTILYKGYYTSQSKIVDLTDLLLPNSKSEMKRVWARFSGARHKPYVIVPNAMDATLFTFQKREVKSVVPDPLKDCVLCVARIEPRKCQLKLIRAMKNIPWPLVLIGKPAPNHLTYFEQIKKEAGSNVYILGHIEHDKLVGYYQAAKVHALVSWFETTGLSSLEAGAMGCNLVITEKGDTRDYFGDYAFYCEPHSEESIRKAIIRAYETPPNPHLQEHILHNYTWEQAAEKTMEGYRYALNY